jgi:hypothetical protein
MTPKSRLLALMGGVTRSFLLWWRKIGYLWFNCQEMCSDPEFLKKCALTPNLGFSHAATQHMP